MVNHGDAPAIVAEAKSSPRTEASSIGERHRSFIAEQASNLVTRYRAARSSSIADGLDDIDYRTLREEAWRDKMEERGLD